MEFRIMQSHNADFLQIYHDMLPLPADRHFKKRAVTDLPKMPVGPSILDGLPIETGLHLFANYGQKYHVIVPILLQKIQM